MVKVLPIAIATLFGLSSLAEAKFTVHSRKSNVEKRAQVTISTSQRNSAINGYLGNVGDQTSIAPGVTYWLSGFALHNVFGSLDNSGRFYISQTDSSIRNPGGQSSYLNTGSLNNRAGASIQLNDVSAISAPSYYWSPSSFQNDGTFQWCGRGDTGGSTFRLTCGSTCVNNGLIVFEQVNGNFGTAMTWRNDVLTLGSITPSQTITNNGAFLMRKARVDFVQNYQGNGCYVIGNQAIMYLQDGAGLTQNPNAGPAFNSQSIRFADNTGVLHMDTGVYSRNSQFGATVYGFGEGNAIEFYQLISSFTYSGDTLTVNFIGGSQVKIKIGSGYSFSGFSNKLNKTFYGAFNAIFYTGTAPSGNGPASCQLSTPVCGPLDGLDIGAGSTTTTTSTTSTSTTSTSTTSTTTTSATTSATTSGTTTTTTSASTTSTQAPPAVQTTFKYNGKALGCFRDNAGFGGSRTMNAVATASDQLTNQFCANFCGERGFRYSGTEYRSECFCSASAPTIAAQNCDQSCSGDASQTCGGSWALTVYENQDIASPVIDTLPTNFKSEGCFLDSVNARTFSAYSFNADNMTPKLCATTCSDKGFAYSGTEYGRECYCSGYSALVTSDQCNMACSGGAAQVCGGPNALSVIRDNNVQASSGPTCPSLPAGYAVCRNGQKVVDVACVAA